MVAVLLVGLLLLLTGATRAASASPLHDLDFVPESVPATTVVCQAQGEGCGNDRTPLMYDAAARVALEHDAGLTATEAAMVGLKFGRARVAVSDGRIYDSTASFVAPNGTPANTLYHYTDEAGLDGIASSGELRPSLRSVNPNDVRYGNGQYVSDIVPGSRTCAQLSRCFLGQPFQGQRFTHFVEINVDGLNAVKGRDGVFVIPGDSPLDLTGRIVSSGPN
jgi:hypothetical protein